MKKKYKFRSLIHQFFKEILIAKNKGKPYYLLLKYFPKYIIENRIKHNRLELELPWISYPAYIFLDSYIKPNMNVFEYGAGSSTLFFSKKGLNLFSTEHNELWFKKLSHIINTQNIQHVELKLIPPEKSNSEEKITSNKDSKFIGFDFSNYANSILSFEDQFFDIILIDGRVRNRCLKNSLKKVKKGGLIIFDNADRIEYSDGIKDLSQYLFLNDYSIVEFDLFFSQTNIYVNKWSL